MRTWTLSEFFALPDDYAHRTELVDGRLIVHPLNLVKHQAALTDVSLALYSHEPTHLQTLPGINVLLRHDRVLIPDVAVTVPPHSADRHVDASRIVMVVEIVSTLSWHYDRMRKRAMYAEAGIPHYLLVDRSGPGVEWEALRLESGEYRTVMTEIGDSMRLVDPFPVEIKLG